MSSKIESIIQPGDCRTVTFSELARHTRQEIKILEKEPTCSICLVDEPYSDFVITECQHVFHFGCLNKWFRRHNENTCPLCRQNKNIVNRNDVKIENHLLATCIRAYHEEDRCAICFSQLFHPEAPWVSLECNHHYHFDCFMGWRKKRNLCPLDNKEPIYKVNENLK